MRLKTRLKLFFTLKKVLIHEKLKKNEDIYLISNRFNTCSNWYVLTTDNVSEDWIPFDMCSTEIRRILINKLIKDNG